MCLTTPNDWPYPLIKGPPVLSTLHSAGWRHGKSSYNWDTVAPNNMFIKKRTTWNPAGINHHHKLLGSRALFIRDVPPVEQKEPSHILLKMAVQSVVLHYGQHTNHLSDSEMQVMPRPWNDCLCTAADCCWVALSSRGPLWCFEWECPHRLIDPWLSGSGINLNRRCGPVGSVTRVGAFRVSKVQARPRGTLSSCFLWIQM